jgi:peptide/nickel transport system permease protein
MGTYIARRLIYMVVTLLVVSVLSFIIIQLPPGDVISTRIAQLQSTGMAINKQMAESMRQEYGLDRPVIVQYGKWMGKLLRGDLGYSFTYRIAVTDIIKERLPYSILLALLSTVLVYLISVPLGIISAVRQHTTADYVFTLLSFIGLSIPSFLLAMILMYFVNKLFGLSIGGLFSQEFMRQPWSLARLGDLVRHIWAPIIVLSAGGSAITVRVLRATMLDELGKEYVQVGRAKGLPEGRLIIRHPARVALNPVLSTVGYVLPAIISGEAITSVVMDLPTMGPVLLQGALTQDMFLVGDCMLIMSFLTIVGTLVSDILLAVSDPRIKYY